VGTPKARPQPFEEFSCELDAPDYHPAGRHGRIGVVIPNQGISSGGGATAALPTGTVTFLFSDIEGSTALLRELGRNRYGDLLARHNALLREAFAAAGGTEIDRQGDAFFAAFTSASAAAAAAVAAQRALAAEDWPEGSSVRVRMGLHTGEATVADGSYVGFAVHQAARIGDAGHGAQVLVSTTTASLIEHNLPSDVGLRDLGEARLPGLERPERLHQLVVEGLPSDFPPLADRAAELQAAPAPLLEREAELAAVEALVDVARSGGGRLVAIEGRAGMGKTRLVAEAKAVIERAGLTVLSARGGELEHEFAYGVVRQLFEPLLMRSAPAEREELFSGAAALAAPLFEATGGEGDTSFAMLHGLYWLAANAALRRPTALLVDDLHWADAASLRWLLHLARRADGLPLLVLVALRPPQQGRESELLTELVADPATVAIRPGSLGRESVGVLARRLLGAEPEAPFVDACHRATGGNPLYLRALLDTLARESVPPTAAEAARVVEIGPGAVARAVELRLSRLPSEATALVRAAAILGDGAEVRFASALAGLELDAAGHATTTLIRADLLQSQPRLEFIHPVVRTAVYEGVPPGERVAAHRRAAAILAEAGREPEQAAAHLLLSAPAGDASAVDILRAAAERALRRGAPDVAATYLRRALDEPPGEAVRVDILCELGLAVSRLDIEATIRYLGEAIAHLDEPVRRARIALELGKHLRWIGRGPEAVPVFEDALDRLGDADRELRHLIEAELISSFGVDPEINRAIEARIEAVRGEQLVGEFGAAVMLATLRYYDARRGVHRELAGALAEPEVVRALTEGDVSTAVSTAGLTLVLAGATDLAGRYFDAAVEAAKRRGELVMLGSMLTYRGYLHIYRGDLAAAEDDLRQPPTLVSYGRDQPIPAFYQSYLAEVLVERGELEDAEAALAQLGLGEEVAVRTYLIPFLVARGKLRVARRDLQRARDDFERLGRHVEAFGIANPSFAAWRSHLALVLAGLGERERARTLAEEEVELARTWGAPRAIGVALRAQGLVLGGAGGLASLREAVEVLESSPARLELARALVDLGAALRRANQRAESRDYLRRGLELAHRSGAGALEELAQAELAATGARPRRPVVSGVDALTPSERRVAEMAAENMTNKDIAQALFVTPKTVEVHLSSVYRKLDISSRSQLASALRGD
jgi:class 3 adenylate cyclase/DNA-binding CsgD family transcriptional regulator